MQADQRSRDVPAAQIRCQMDEFNRGQTEHTDELDAQRMHRYH